MENTVIELSELRIGNLLEYKGEIVYVSMLSLDIDDEYQDQIGITNFGASSKEAGGWNRSLVNDLSRVPLTDKWLEKLGFVKDNAPFCYVHPTKDVVIFTKNEANNVDCPYYLTGRAQAILLRYVHRIQNLFFSLTEEELVFLP